MRDNYQALTITERNFVKQAADSRYFANGGEFGRDIAEYRTQAFNLSRQQAGRLGAFCEAAWFKRLGGNVLDHELTEWAHYVPNDHADYDYLVKQKADLFKNVEVRRANNRDNLIPVRPKDDGFIVVQAFVDYKQPLPSPENPTPGITVPLHAELLGWAYSTDEGEQPWWSDGSSIVVPRRSMDTFPWDEVERHD